MDKCLGRSFGSFHLVSPIFTLWIVNEAIGGCRTAFLMDPELGIDIRSAIMFETSVPLMILIIWGAWNFIYRLGKTQDYTRVH